MIALCKILKGLLGLLVGIAVAGLVDLRRDEAARAGRSGSNDVVAIIIALVLAFLAFRFVAGMVKFGVLALIVLA